MKHDGAQEHCPFIIQIKQSHHGASWPSLLQQRCNNKGIPGAQMYQLDNN